MPDSIIRATSDDGVREGLAWDNVVDGFGLTGGAVWPSNGRDAEVGTERIRAKTLKTETQSSAVTPINRASLSWGKIFFMGALLIIRTIKPSKGNKAVNSAE